MGNPSHECEWNIWVDCICICMGIPFLTTISIETHLFLSAITCDAS